MTKIEQAFALYQEGFFVRDIAEALEVNPRTIRGYIYRTRHPERYAARVQAYVQRHRGKGKKTEPKKTPSDKDQAVKRAAELKRKRHKVSAVAAKPPVRNIRAEIAAIIKQAGARGKKHGKQN